MTFENGIYVAYLSGTEGQGVAFLVIRNGLVIGTDIVGSTFDGTLAYEDHSNSIAFSIEVTQVGDLQTVQGRKTSPGGESFILKFSIP